MKKRMMQGHSLAVNEARTERELKKRVIRFGKDLGFRTISALIAIDRPKQDPLFKSVHNTPRGYLECYENVELYRLDPVTQHCKKTWAPIIWDQNLYVSQGCGKIWEHQARYGYRNGVCIAMHFTRGRHFMLGVDTDRPLPKDAAHLEYIVSELTMFANHAQEAAFRILAPANVAAKTPPPLTNREHEVLCWTMDGNSPKEISDLMRISIEDIIAAQDSVLIKFGCVTKYEAVIKALSLKLIS